MPEGDNVHAHERELEGALGGAALERVWVRGLEQPALRGKRVESVEARGKHLLIALEGGWTVRVHLGINGGWRRVERARLAGWQVARSHLALATATVAYLCKAREVELVRTAFVRSHRALAALGPDLLGRAPDLDEVVRRARATPHRTLADLLLDQRVAAGLGNVYKSELLFLHRLSPFASPATVDDAALRAIYEDGRRLLGANLGPWPRTTTADRSRGALPPRGRGRYWVFERARRPCYRCGTPIAVAYQGDQVRRTFYCPRCQSVDATLSD